MPSKDSVEQDVEALLISGQNVAGIEERCNLLFIAVVSTAHELSYVVTCLLICFLHRSDV